MAKKVFLHIPNDNASSLYRGILPLYHLYQFLSENDILLVGDQKPLKHEEFDAYIFNRVVKTDFYNDYIEALIKSGKQLIWQADDDVWNIPLWNPSRKLLGKYDLVTTNAYVEHAKRLITSTQPLADLVGKPEKTDILPNLVDLTYFNNKIIRKDDRIKILWAGSVTHDADLEIVIDPLIRLLQEYGDKIAVIFWGYLPTRLAEFDREPGYPIASLVPKYPNLYWGEWFSTREYYCKLRNLVPDIAIMPLAPCVFNNSKSGIKYFEMSLAGAACVATDMAPYSCVKDYVTGLKVPTDNPDYWYDAIKELIDNKLLRHELNKNAIEQVRNEFSWQSSAKEVWRNAFLSFMQDVGTC